MYSFPTSYTRESNFTMMRKYGPSRDKCHFRTCKNCSRARAIKRTKCSEAQCLAAQMVSHTTNTSSYNSSVTSHKNTNQVNTYVPYYPQKLTSSVNTGGRGGERKWKRGKAEEVKMNRLLPFSFPFRLNPLHQGNFTQLTSFEVQKKPSITEIEMRQVAVLLQMLKHFWVEYLQQFEGY